MSYFVTFSSVTLCAYKSLYSMFVLGFYFNFPVCITSVGLFVQYVVFAIIFNGASSFWFNFDLVNTTVFV